MTPAEELNELRAIVRKEVELGHAISEMMAKWIDGGIELRRTLENRTAALDRLIPTIAEKLAAGGGEVENG